MDRLAAFVLVYLIFGPALSAPGQAAVVKSYQDLTPAQLVDLEVSEANLMNDDRDLLFLERDRKNRKISEQDYEFQCHQLVNYINAEACFQNYILTKRPRDIELPEGANKVLRTVGKYSVCVLVAALRIGLGFAAAASG